MKFTTSTPKGTEGINISYSDEKRCADTLQPILPEDWEVHFDWCQILFSDVQYQIAENEKKLFIQYNQNLTHWWKELLPEVKGKLAKP